MKLGCAHEQYTKQQIDQKWQGHSVCLVLVRRVCNGCGLKQDDWEFGDHESNERMLNDEVNYFSGQPFPEVCPLKP